MRRRGRRWLVARIAAVALLALGSSSSRAADCGGATLCACGDRVVRDTVLTADIGPCVWGSDPTELVGIRIDSNVTLDCANHSIRGPADRMKQEFGVKFGSASRPVDNAAVRNCDVSGFWWGVYVASSTNITVESNSIHDNGWKDPNANGTGYGIDVTGMLAGPGNVIVVRQNEIANNGNEGVHLSTSSGVEIAGNALSDNGKEQIYLLSASANDLHDNEARRGTQGLEMRDSAHNSLSYNRWLESPLQLLEGSSAGNAFVYDDFEGVLRVGRNSPDNAFSFAHLENPGGVCADVSGDATVFRQSWFADCKAPSTASATTTLDRSVGLPPGRLGGALVAVHTGCNADIDGDGTVGPADAAAVAAALGTAPGDPSWNPAADLDRDRMVGPRDQEIVAWQAGPCPVLDARPRPKLLATVVVDGPNGSPDTVRLDAAASQDPDGRIVLYQIAVKDRLTRDVVASADLFGVDPASAHLQSAFPPGSYVASLTVTDNYWQRSRAIKRQFRVR